MGWNARIIRRICETTKEISYGIHEVIYDDKTGEMESYTAEPMDLTGNNLRELKEYYILLGKAFNRPILYEHDYLSENNCAWALPTENAEPIEDAFNKPVLYEEDLPDFEGD